MTASGVSSRPSGGHPHPVWGESTGEHTRFSVYLAGSMLAWAVAGLVMAALIGSALGLVV